MIHNLRPIPSMLSSVNPQRSQPSSSTCQQFLRQFVNLLFRLEMVALQVPHWQVVAIQQSRKMARLKLLTVMILWVKVVARLLRTKECGPRRERNPCPTFTATYPPFTLQLQGVDVTEREDSEPIEVLKTTRINLRAVRQVIKDALSTTFLCFDKLNPLIPTNSFVGTCKMIVDCDHCV